MRNVEAGAPVASVVPLAPFSLVQGECDRSAMSDSSADAGDQN